MASLTGTKIKDTYDGLLKTTDNGGLGASAKQITDGLGTGSPVYISTSNIGVNDTVSGSVATNYAPKLLVGGQIIARSLTANEALISLGGDTDGAFISAGKQDGSQTARPLRFEVGSSEAMRIDSSGNVKIKGTNTKLSWERASDSSPDIVYLTKKQDISTNGNAKLHGYDGIVFSTGGSESERMRIDSSGNVGIGKVPSEKLDIEGASPFIRLSNTDETESGIVFADSASAAQSAKITYDSGASNALIFYNNAASERMRITSGGYLKASNTGTYVSATGTYHELYNNASDSTVNITNSHASSPYGTYIRFDSNPNNTTNWFLRCASQGGVTRLFIYSNGNVVNTNNSYGALSDAKLKENVTDASPKLDDLMQVKVRNYNLIGDDKKQLGVVAQELETIFPAMIDESTDFEEREVELRDENGEIVYETEQVLVSEEIAEVTEEVLHEAIAEELDADGNVIVEAQEAWTETIIVTPFQEAVYETVTTDVPVMTTEKFDLGTTTKSVKYSVFVPMLIKAIQELKAEVDALKGA